MELLITQVAPYCRRIEEFVAAALPPLPKQWNYAPGWTRYGPDGNVMIIIHLNAFCKVQIIKQLTALLRLCSYFVHRSKVLLINAVSVSN